MFIFRYSKTTHVYYQNFLKENKHCKFSISFLLTIHEILSNSNKKHFRVRKNRGTLFAICEKVKKWIFATFSTQIRKD